MGIFDLKGPLGSFHGQGNSNGEPEKTGKFPLRQGVTIVHITHNGTGNFELRFSSAEVSGGRQTGAAGLGRRAMTGAAIGGIVGGVLGATAGAIAGRLLGRQDWTTETLTGEVEDYWVIRIDDENRADLKPGEYQLEVLSESGWKCEFLQPNLGQAVGSLVTDDPRETEGQPGKPGTHILPPQASGRRPVRATIQHSGAGEFKVSAFSVDGTDKVEIYTERGQFYIEDMATEIRPGKEYILMVEADGEWDIDFTEGY